MPSIPENLKPKIFISHSSDDSVIVDTLVERLRKDYRIWVSSIDVQPGDTWDNEINLAITRSDAVIVLLSKSAAESIYVRSEVHQAISLRKKLIPVKLDQEAILPLGLNAFHAIDWDSRKTRRSIRQLIGALPRTSGEILEETFNTSSYQDVKELILRNREWLPMEYGMINAYRFLTDPRRLSGYRGICCEK